MTTGMQCSECGASYADDADSCAARFQQLLALDHSRREPWGSRHGQAFAAFALQHPLQYPTSIDSAWTALYRIYCLRESPTQVFAAMRIAAGSGSQLTLPPRPRQPVTLPTVTIADLGSFAATHYAADLDAWCLSALQAWGASIDVA